ncbi:ATP-binding protein [Oligoflexus tunisiensis]|uniref:ATP-binding protein n=1 Tax=Oligoflexus tunisiensis TaxID=708132 RepID=UPI00114D0CB3|nr:ATP-binding protein [Oligoflexus tunisiensis]
MMQRKSSLGYRIGGGFILSFFLSSLFAILVSGYFLKQNFDERSSQSSILVSRFIASSMKQYIGRLTSGLDALNGDADLLHDIVGSLGTPSPRRKNFFKLFTKVEDFARHYGLEQVSIYLKPLGREDYPIFSTIVPKENHVFTFSPEKNGADMVEISRDEYGLVSIKDNGLTHFKFRFSNEFLGPDRKIALMRVDGKVYLDINYPMVNELIGSDGAEDAFIKKGSTYGVIRIVMPLPDSFISELETQTGHRISFYDPQLQYVAGILQHELDVPGKGGFVAQGTDGVEYINYLSSVNFDGSEVARIVVSFENSQLTEKIVSMIFMIFGVNMVSSSLLLVALSLFLRKRVIRPIERLTENVKALTDGDLKSWQGIPQRELTSRSDELQILRQAFRTMGRQLDELVNNLEENVQERTQQIILEKQKTQGILNNIEEGIITFNDELIVGAEYSRHMYALLDLTPEQIKGASFTELILDRSNISADGRHTIREILRICLGMPPLSWEMNHANLPSSMEVTVQGAPRYMSLDWYPMLNDQGLVERGMLVIKDQTEKVLLQQDLNKSNELHECLSEIIDVAMKFDIDFVARFIERARRQFLTDGSQLMELAKTRPDAMFALLHTLKGDARTTGFQRIAAKAHDAESMLHHLRSRTCHESDLLNFHVALNELTSEISEFSGLMHDLFSRRESRCDLSVSLIDLLLPHFQEAVSILKENGIKVGGFLYEDHVQDWSSRTIEQVKDMIMHAITNSADHGYVLPKKAGHAVATAARFHVKASLDHDNVVIEIVDEGHGYDLEKIRRKYGLSHETADKETLAMLLESGVTTTSDVTTLSGRGVGLNAIKELSQGLGGSTCLEPHFPRGALVKIVLPRQSVMREGDLRLVG